MKNQSATANQPLNELGVSGLLQGYRSKTFSPVEVMQSVITQITLCEPHLCATYLFNPERALLAARESEARWFKSQPRGLLDGIPTTIKENIATEGDPTPLGTAATVLIAAAQDAPPAARLKESGAIMVSKTTMPDYGMLSSGLSSFHATARNPWDLSRTPGGSSAGAGSAAAAFYGPLHLGTDIGGSVRLPASWCGLVGLKPSLGLVAIDPPYTGRVAGPMTRSVSDAAWMMQVLAQPDPRDAMGLPAQNIDWQSVASATPESAQLFLKGKRIGLLLDAGCGLSLDPVIRSAVSGAAKIMQQAGAHVEQMSPFFTVQMLSGLDYFWRMRSLIDLNGLPAPKAELVLPFIKQWAQSAQAMTGEQLFAAQHQIYLTRIAAVRACAQFDYVISPTAPVLAFPAQFACPTNDPIRALEHIAYTVPFNMSEQPAVSINCDYSPAGLPIGLQIIGQRFDDLGVLKMAQAFESLRPEQRHWQATYN
jgi:aspartyl-tRNA(Asn)/glutamyl-tRNA(Gln) amidotransferase subunit A